METRRTLEKEPESRDLKASDLKVGFCVSLTDSDENNDTLFVARITETDITFADKLLAANQNYQVILTREGDTLRDAKNRLVTIYGRVKQYGLDGKEI